MTLDRKPGEKTSKDGIPVFSVTEVDEGLHNYYDDDRRTKLAWRQADRWARMERQQGELESEKLGSVGVT